jgi:hypothetical protein
MQACSVRQGSTHRNPAAEGTGCLRKVSRPRSRIFSPACGAEDRGRPPAHRRFASRACGDRVKAAVGPLRAAQVQPGGKRGDLARLIIRSRRLIEALQEFNPNYPVDTTCR